MSTELYKKIVFDRSKSRRFYGKPEGSADSAFLSNPLCGDEITVYASRDGAYRYEAYGCAICMCSADLMAETLTGKTPAEAKETINDFLALIEQGSPLSERLTEFQDDYTAVAKVREFPSRLKCATLPWLAAEQCLKAEPGENPQ